MGNCFRKDTERAFLWHNGKVTDLGAVASRKQTSATAINDDGQVSGYSWTKLSHYAEPLDPRAFVWRNGQMTDLGPGWANTLNNVGQVVGGAGKPGFMRAVVWQQGTLTYLSPKRVAFSYSIAINNHGLVAMRVNVNDPNEHAWLWLNGRPADLGAARVAAINEPGQVLVNFITDKVLLTYNTGALWQNGKTTHLPRNDDWEALNDHGQIVGSGGTPFHARLWQNGTVTDLGTITGARQSGAYLINNLGQIVGVSGNLSNVEPAWKRAFLWQNGKVTDLGTLPGDKESAPSAINDDGEIVGVSTTKNGKHHAVVWRRVTP